MLAVSPEMVLTIGTIVQRKSDPTKKQGRVMAIRYNPDNSIRAYSIKWPKRRRDVSPSDLREVAHQATLFEVS